MNNTFSKLLAIIVFLGSTANFCAPNYSTNDTNTNNPAESKKWQHLDKLISEQDSTPVTPHTLGILTGLFLGLGASLNDDKENPVVTNPKQGIFLFGITWPATFFIIKGIGHMMFGPYQYRNGTFNFFQNASKKRLFEKLPAVAVESILSDRDTNTITINYGHNYGKIEYIPSKKLFYNLENLLDRHFDNHAQ